MMKFWAASLFVLAVLAVPQIGCAAPTAAQGPVADDVDQLHLPGYDGTPTGSTTIEFEIAPEIASHSGLGSDARTTATTDLALTLSHAQPLGDRVEIELEAGPALLHDTGRIVESALAGAIELRSTKSASGFAVFGRYEVAQLFDGFFKGSLDTEQIASAGVRYGAAIGTGEIGIELAPRWMNSSFDLDDYVAGELFIDTAFPLASSGISLIGELSIDRRWYLNSDPAIGTKRRDWRVEAFVGLDFAEALEPLLGEGNPIHALSVGLLWLDANSSLPSADRSSFKVLPAITFGKSF